MPQPTRVKSWEKEEDGESAPGKGIAIVIGVLVIMLMLGGAGFLAYKFFKSSTSDNPHVSQNSRPAGVDSNSGLRWDVVSKGYLTAFGGNVTIGRVFDVVSAGSAEWSAGRLATHEPEYATHYLVEATWYNDKFQRVKCQFLVKLYGDDFKMHGAFINGESMDFLMFQAAVKQIWIDKGGTLN